MSAIAKGNLMGLGALVLWSTIVGLVRSVTEAFGVVAGTALIYTVGTIATFVKMGVPDFSKIPKTYLFGVGLLFVLYEVVFSSAIGMSVSSRQTLEIGMLNYLWPCLTVIFSIWINKVKLRWIVWPGTVLAIIGLYISVAANGNLDFQGLVVNILKSPLPYVLGFTAAVSWALYSNLSIRYSKGFNAVPFFFFAIAVLLWINFFLQGGELHYPGIVPICQLLFIGVVIGFSYYMWENGIHNGNFIFLAVCSYFTPVLSMLFASVWLGVIPPVGFWVGVVLLVGGSLLCWLSNYKR